MAKTVYFVRHGQTQGNVLRYPQGPEEPLNQSGIHEAEVVGKRCRSLVFSSIITSDMVRAKATAQQIARKYINNVSVQETLLLREVSVDESLSGPDAPKASIADFKAELSDRLNDDAWFKKHGAESYKAIQTRAQSAWKYLADYENESVLVVSHGTFMKFMLADVLLGSSATMSQLHQIRMNTHINNTGISQFTHSVDSNRWQMQIWNDISHFAE